MDKYKILISEVDNVLRPLGFRKSGQTFFYNKDGNIGIIDFQKARSSNAASGFFTINLGVYSNALKVFDNFDVKSKPLISDCHWRKRRFFTACKKRLLVGNKCKYFLTRFDSRNNKCFKIISHL